MIRKLWFKKEKEKRLKHQIGKRFGKIIQFQVAETYQVAFFRIFLFG